MRTYLLTFSMCSFFLHTHAQFDRPQPDIKKHEIGLNPMDVMGVFFGASPSRHPMSVHYKYNLGNKWLRTGLYYENFWATSNLTQRLEDSLLVQRFEQSDAWALSGSLGLEKRKPLPNNFAFTYGADLMYRYFRETSNVRELLYDDYRIDSSSSTTVQYFRNAASIDSRELQEDLWVTNQYGIRVTAGLQHYLHANWLIHLQASVAYFYGRNVMTSYFPATGMTSGRTFSSWELQSIPLFNELAVYYRF